MSTEVDVAVLGAGPAGVAAAATLRKLGYSVMLIGVARNAAIEGLSQRAHARLVALGLQQAVRCARAPGRRSGTWAGVTVGTNSEYVVDRADFDRALGLDAVSHSVVLRNEWVTAVEGDGAAWRIRTRSAEIRCRAVVDARGRRIRRAECRGPSLIAIAQRLEGVSAAAPESLIYPVELGWCWFAADGRGSAVLQLVTSSRGLSATRAELARRLLDCMPEVLEHYGMAVPVGPPTAHVATVVPVGSPTARPATARLALPSREVGYVRAGDAALACDPLSGHGLYEALRSAHVAAIAIHTFLTRNTWDLVERFLNDTYQHVWNASMGAAAAFYRQQADCTPTPFWTQAACAYSEMRGSNS